ncbi:MAG: response regulator [Chloroflexota bacterium]|nr:response regulator [Chloroflexota bacterium]
MVLAAGNPYEQIESRNTRILVVEDDLNLLEGIQTVLELDQYTVVCAENGRQALEILQSTTTPPDLIVSDIMMPQMDGIEFLRAVRQVDDWINIPFIFLTARGEKQDILRGKQLGVDDYLVKPFDAQDLIITIENKLERMRRVIRKSVRGMDELKTRILMILNHEFRTPLTYVVAYSDMLEEATEQPLSDEEMSTFLRGVSTGAVRLRRLIENFIQLVEMETGEARRTYDLRKTPITDARALWESALRDIRAVRPLPQPIDLIIDSVPVFTGDETYLRLALTHLIDNASKFSAPDRPIALGAHHVDGMVCLWIQDQGRGIDPSEQDRIWETFYQIERWRHEDPGTGSGLAIVRNVAGLHHGRASVESQLGKGSRFSIFIPARS